MISKSLKTLLNNICYSRTILYFQGTIAASEGSTKCEPCVEGKYQSGQGKGKCASCPVGRITNAPGMTVCTICEPVSMYSYFPCELQCVL